MAPETEVVHDRPLFPWIGLDALKAEFRLSSSGDTYGNCMAWWFAVAAEIDLRGDEVPPHWHYRPGAGGSQREAESYEAGICEEATSEALHAFGEMMCRLYAICKARGVDY